MKKFLIICLFLTTNLLVKAQNIEAGFFLGTAFYNGDIDVNLGNVFPQMRPAIGVFGRYHLNPTFALRAQVYVGKLFADEKNYGTSAFRSSRGFSFSSPVTEVSAVLEANLINLDRNFAFDRNDPFLSFYGFGGVGGAFFDPITNFNEPNPIIDDVSIDKFAVYPKSSVVLIGGGGAKVKLTNELTLGLEVGVRKTFTDYLDGISLLVGPKAKDYYFFSGATISWSFGGGNGGRNGNWGNHGKNVGCPTF